MEDLLRTIIREELSKIKEEIEGHQSTFTPRTSEEEIIHSFEGGKRFGINKLAKDIKGLDHYYMNDYFPISDMEDRWMFEIEASYGATQDIEIVHKINSEGKSLWSMKISDMESGSNIPQIKKSSPEIEGYRNFTQKINHHLERMINPELL